MNLNDPLISTLVPLVLLFGIFYFLLIRPQQQRLKTHQQLVNSVKRGDTVVTAGGMIGRVAKVNGRDRRQCAGSGPEKHADRSAVQEREVRRLKMRRGAF
jgi:preprotein translocase subunit YajC